MTYELIKTPIDKAFYLGTIRDLFDPESELDFYVPTGTQKLNRRVFDGFFTLVGKINSEKVALCYNDFRSFGSTFGVDNSVRVGAFLEYLTEKKIPLIYLANSSGVRIQDSRRVFKNTFTLVAKIKAFAKDNLYITACLGQSLGLSALMYSLGDYRYSLKGVSKFNLTGPEVFKMFFGARVDFDKACSGEQMLFENLLVQELANDQVDLFNKLKNLLNKNKQVQAPVLADSKDIMNWLYEDSLEVFGDFGKSLKICIKNTEKGRVGVFFNPINKPNMMSVKDITKFRFGLQLFEKLKLPIINFVDTPGGDPRITENDNNIAGHLYELASDIIDYPFYKRGVIAGRCFGGSSILTLPVFFGGDKTLILKGAKIGIMDNKIIEQLLTNAKPLLDIWRSNVEKEPDDYQDYVDEELVEPVIEVRELYTKLISSLP